MDTDNKQVSHIFESMDHCPLTKLFLSTQKNAKSNTTLAWMREISSEDLQNIADMADKLEQESSDYLGEDVLDYVSLSWCLASFETNKPLDKITNEMLEDCAVNAGLLATFESLRRKSIVNIEGEGKSTDIKTTNVVATDIGMMMADGMNTARKLGEMMEKEINKQS